MKTRTKIILWTLPLLVIVLTFLYIYVIGNGLNVPWKLVGKPSENISKIIGFNPGKLYVETASGEMYFLKCDYMGFLNPSPYQWGKDENYTKALDPFYRIRPAPPASPLPLFKVKQIYQFVYAETDSFAVIKFALSEDGNLWFWTHGGGGLQGVLYILELAGEILLYIIALLINFVIFLAKRIIRKIRSFTPNNH
jgi:hypothetical protein